MKKNYILIFIMLKLTVGMYQNLVNCVKNKVISKDIFFMHVDWFKYIIGKFVINKLNIWYDGDKVVNSQIIFISAYQYHIRGRAKEKVIDSSSASNNQ